MRILNLIMLLCIFSLSQITLGDSSQTGSSLGSIASSCSCTSVGNIDFGTLTASSASTKTSTVNCSGNDDNATLTVSASVLDRDISGSATEEGSIPVAKTAASGTSCKKDEAAAACENGVTGQAQTDGVDGSYTDVYTVSLAATAATSDLQGNYDGDFTVTYTCNTN